MPGRLQLAAEKPEGLLNDPIKLIDAFLCRVLRGESAPWTSSEGFALEAFLERCRHHGVAALLFHAAHQSDHWLYWPLKLRQALEQASRAGVAQEMLSSHYLKQLIQELARQKVPCLLLKGEALAASLYAMPGTRTRSDSDLFIRISDIAMVKQVVKELGYEIVSPVYRSHQFTVMRPGDRTGNVRFDIHWRISNAPRFARMLSFEEAYGRSIDAPGLRPARMLDKPDALLLACVHRFGSERHNRDRLIWLHDIRALTESMSESELLRFAQRAVDRGVGAVCLDGLLQANQCFDIGLQDAVAASLQGTAKGESVLCRWSQSSLGLLLDDWKRLQGVRARVGLLQELFLPSGQSLLSKYNKTNRLWLPLLYLRRMFGGLQDLLSPR